MNTEMVALSVSSNVGHCRALQGWAGIGGAAAADCLALCDAAVLQSAACTLLTSPLQPPALWTLSQPNLLALFVESCVKASNSIIRSNRDICVIVNELALITVKHNISKYPLDNDWRHYVICYNVAN